MASYSVMDEEKGQHDQQEHHPREKDDDAEEPPEIAREGDIAEPERRHHDERPVEAGNPGILLAFHLDLDHVEEHRVGGDEEAEKREVSEKSRHVRARLAGGEQEAQLTRQILHREPGTLRPRRPRSG